MNQKEYEIIHNLYPESTLTIKSKIHIKILGNDCWNYKLSTYYVILYTLKKSESWKNDWIHFQIQMSKNINHDITFHRIEVIMIKLPETFLVQWYSYVWKINVWTILKNYIQSFTILFSHKSYAKIKIHKMEIAIAVRMILHHS